MEEGYSLDKVLDDFAKLKRGVVTFTYNDILETLSYVPIKGTDWMLTYLIRESVLGNRISSVSDGIIRRSLVQTILTALVLCTMFVFLVIQLRKNAKLALEKEASETESRVKH